MTTSSSASRRRADSEDPGSTSSAHQARPFRARQACHRLRTATGKRGGGAVELTATEYELLRVLSLNAGRVATFESLLRQVWNRQGYGDPKIVRAYIKMIRQKLGDDSNQPRYTFNVRGVGYCMARPGEIA